jgi:hypothetical protein
MTKQQFLSGVQFYVLGKSYNGASTYSYNESANCMMRQSRSSIDERVVMDEYECNVPKITKTGFTGFTFVINKKVVVRYKFEDLVIFEQGV